MPITIISPPEGSPFGWGMPFNVITDLDHNTLPVGEWRVQLLQSPTFENFGAEWLFPFAGSSLTQPLGRGSTGQWQIPIPLPGMQQGLPGKIRIDLIDGTGTSVQQQVAGFTNEHQTGMPLITTTTTTQVQGGFTAVDRETIQATLEAVAGELPSSEVDGVAVAKTLWELLSCPPDSLLCRRDSVQVQGDETLTRPGVLGPVSAYGVSLDFSILPERLGVKHGAVDLAQERLIQVAMIRSANCGDEYISQINEVHQRHFDIRWCDPMTIKRLEVSVLPGVTAGWTWLGLPGT